MILVIDVGNTNIVLGVYRADPKEDKLLNHWRISTDRQKSSDEYGMVLKNLFDFHGLDFRGIKDMIISSVVPPLTPVLERMAKRYFGLTPLIIGPGVKTSMPILYENPREVGADRVVNGVAAYKHYGGPLIVVDFGTAITFCVISQKGEYLGGAIAPGIGISTEALFQRAAKLPRIELVKPKSVIGKNTVSGMQAGIIFGFVGQVDGIVSRIKEELGTEAYVVATGGMAELIAKESRTINKVDPLLTLEGLRLILHRNRA